jgi:Transglycosylase SLT domain
VEPRAAIKAKGRLINDNITPQCSKTSRGKLILPPASPSTQPPNRQKNFNPLKNGSNFKALLKDVTFSLIFVAILTAAGYKALSPLNSNSYLDNDFFLEPYDQSIWDVDSIKNILESEKQNSYPTAKLKALQINAPVKESQDVLLMKKIIQKIFTQINSSRKVKFNPVNLTTMIVSESLKLGFDPLLITAIISSESAFNHTAVSPVGARGLMQIMPKTKDFIERYEKIPYLHRRDLNNPRYNIRLGISYLKYLIKRFKGNKSISLMAYNWGPTHVDNVLSSRGYKRVPSSVTRYSDKILRDHTTWRKQIVSNLAEDQALS